MLIMLDLPNRWKRSDTQRCSMRLSSREKREHTFEKNQVIAIVATMLGWLKIGVCFGYIYLTVVKNKKILDVLTFARCLELKPTYERLSQLK